MPLGAELLLSDDEPELPAAPEEPDEVSAAPDEPEVPDVPEVPAAPGEAAPLLPEVSAGFSFAAFGTCFLTCLRLCFGFLVSMPLSELLVPAVA